MSKETLNLEDLAIEVSDGAVILPLDRFEELIVDRVRMGMILKAYNNPKTGSWDYAHILELMFGEKPTEQERKEEGEGNAE